MDIYKAINHIINNKAAYGLLCIALGILMTHFFYKSKLKKERKVRSEEVIGKQIAESLVAVRDVELEADVIEVFNFESRLEEAASFHNLFRDETYFPAIMTSPDTLFEFYDKISELRKNHEKNLKCKAAAYLLYIERYLMQLSIYIAQIGMIENYPLMGTIFLYDIRNWQKSFHKELIKQINTHSYKLEVHDGLKWRIAKYRTDKILWEKSFLYYRLDDPNTRKSNTINEYVDDIFRAFKQDTTKKQAGREYEGIDETSESPENNDKEIG